MNHMIEQLRLLSDALAHRAKQADDTDDYAREQDLLAVSRAARYLADDLERLEVSV